MPAVSFWLNRDGNALFRRRLLPVGIPGAQRQIVGAGGKFGRNHDELPGFIGDRAIVHLAVSKQFHRCARRRPACNDRFARRIDAGNVEFRHAIAAVRRYGGSGQAADHRVCLGFRRGERGRPL